MSSIIRQDLSTKDWTIFSVKRASRPRDYKEIKDNKLIKKYELVEILTAIQVMVSKIIRIKFSLNSDSVLKKGDDGVLLKVGNRLNFKKLYAFLDKVSISKQLSGGPLDDTLALEDDLISWQNIFS